MSETKYRVWCTSWGETEDDGRDVVGFDPAAGPPPSECLAVAFWNLDDASEAAEYYAEYAHDHHDGHESSWPLTFRVRCPDGTTADYEVERDFSPTFYAARCKERPAS